MSGQGVVRFPDGILAVHPSRGKPTREGSVMSNPFAESFSLFMLTGELPTAEQMREQIEQYESEEKR